MELSPKIQLNIGHRLCGMELSHKKRYLRLSRHFIAMSTVAPLVAIVGDMPLLLRATKNF
jgi:hypothetical protein